MVHRDSATVAFHFRQLQHRLRELLNTFDIFFICTHVLCAPAILRNPKTRVYNAPR